MPALSALDSVEERCGVVVVTLSSCPTAIHAEPELAFDEHRSCAKAQTLVAERGFEITSPARRPGHRVSRRLR